MRLRAEQCVAEAMRCYRDDVVKILFQKKTGDHSTRPDIMCIRE